MKSIQTVLFILSAVLLVSCADYKGLKNTKVTREINLESQFARHTIEVQVSGNGKEYFVAIPQKQADNLAYFEVTDDSGASLKYTVEAAQTENKQSFVPYKVTLNNAISGFVNLKINAVFTDSMAPFPAEIAQGEKQLVKYFDNVYFFTPYATDSQTTIIKLASSSIEKKSEYPPTSVSGNAVTYGPYEDVAAFSNSELFVHFENNKPFITATSVTKEIEISHWGNVAVEEYYDLEHTGAQLKGYFSRFQYQRSYRMATNVVASLRQVLPQGASEVYYRDEIGNISTSHLNYADEGPVMDVIPRYPLFGGWKIGFYFGYNLPTQGYLFTDAKDGGVYMLNMTFASQFPDIAIEELTIRIILPEGSREIDYFAPFGIDAHSFDTHHTYLDTSGRPVLILKKRNVVPEHNKHFQVTYRFSSMSLLQEPILLIGAFFFFYLFVLVAQRIPLSFGDSTSKLGPGSEKLESLLLRLKEVAESRSANHATFEEAVQNYVKNKSEKQYNADKKATDITFANLSKELGAVVSELDEVAADYGKKVREVGRKFDRKLQLHQELADLEVAYKVRKTLDKSSYDKTKNDTNKQYLVIEEEISSVVSDLTDNL